MRLQRTHDSLEIYVAKDVLKNSLVSAASISLLWLIGGARVTVVILLAIALLVAPLVWFARRPARPRRSLARPISPATP